MTKKNIVFHSLFLVFISIWLALILNVISKIYPTNQIALSSSPLFAGYFGLLYWLIAGVSASTSFTLGLDKLGILEVLRKKFPNKDEGYEPEIYVALPKSQPIKSTATSVVKEQLVNEQNNVTDSITNSNILPKQKSRKRKKDSMKAFYLFGETEFSHCEHKFGYLGSKLRNKPIPDECFGCSHILECVGTNEKKREHNVNKERIRRYYGY
jgi:hypothetical protein